MLIGIPRADAVLSLPARRSLGWSGACSARSTDRRSPSATSRTTLDLYRDGRLPLDRLISHRLPLEEAERGFELMHSGDARCGWCSSCERATTSTAGSARAGAARRRTARHINVVLARRGSPTAAAAISMLAHPAPGHTPVLVCVGPTQAEYEPVWPPTLMMNKAHRARRPAPDADLGRCAARDRPGRARRRRRRAARGERRRARARRGVGRPERRTTRPRCGGESRGNAEGDRRVRRRSRPGCGGRARRAARRAAQIPSTRGE